jgi:hypothetical protein
LLLVEDRFWRWRWEEVVIAGDGDLRRALARRW